MSIVGRILPLADRVLVRRLLPATKTAGGLLLPDSAVSKHNEGEVLAVGEGYKSRDGDLIKVSVNVGDKVLLPEYGGITLKSENEELVIYRNDEILAKFTS